MHRSLIRFGAASIETVNSRVLSLAQDDVVWDSVRQYFPEDDGQRAMGVNLVEFVGDTELDVETPVQSDHGSARIGRRSRAAAADLAWHGVRPR